MPNTLFHLQFPTPELPKVFTFDSLFESVDYWTKSSGAGGNIVPANDYVLLHVGGTSGGWAYIHKESLYPPFVNTWEKKRTFRTKALVYHSNDASSDLNICTGNLITANKGFGFKFENNKIKGMSINGGSFASVDLITGLTPTWFNTYLLEAIFDPGSKIEFYIDGVLRGTLQAQLPTSIEFSDFIMRCAVHASGTQTHEITVSGINVTQYL